MAATPFQTTRGYLASAPLAGRGAVAASVAAAGLLVALLPCTYLFVDHLVWKGAVPTYAGLHAGRQDAFRVEWDADLGSRAGVAATLDRVRPPHLDGYVPEAAKWEWRWQAATYHLFETKVGPDAAAAYLTLPDAGDGEKTAALTGFRVGILSLVARDRPRWTHGPLAFLARTAGWTWRPDPAGHFNPAYLTGIFLAALGLVVGYAGCLLAAEYWSAMAALAATTRLRRAVFAHANRLGSLATKPQLADEVSEVFTGKIALLEDGFRKWLTTAWRGPVAVALLAAVLLASHFWLAVSLLLMGVLVWVVGGQVAASFRRDGRAAGRRAAVRLAQMRESLSMLQLVKCYLMERFNQTRVERQLTDFTRSEWRRLRGEAMSGPLVSGFVLAAAVGMLYLAGRAVLAGEFSAGGLAMKGVALGALVNPIRAWVDGRVRIRRAKDAAADVVEFLDRRVDAGQPIDAEFLQPMEKKLEFVDVSYREPGTGRMVLEDVSLAVPVGTRTVIVGSDRSEVHAFAFLLTRFLDPTGGEVRIDGKNIRWVTHESLRTQVAMVTQQCLVFNDTVANNIGCGDPGFSLPQIIEAAKLAHAHQFVQRLPYGYETAIGDAGLALRPGEKLRVALARAVLRDPCLIVVEEPDGPLDPDTKALLDDTFARVGAGRAVVVLSRRMAVLRNADQVVVVHRGRVVGVGTHADLMQHSELYRGMLFQELPAAGVPA